jgi:hypothetical protein
MSREKDKFEELSVEELEHLEAMAEAYENEKYGYESLVEDTLHHYM